MSGSSHCTCHTTSILSSAAACQPYCLSCISLCQHKPGWLPRIPSTKPDKPDTVNSLSSVCLEKQPFLQLVTVVFSFLTLYLFLLPIPLPSLQPLGQSCSIVNDCNRKAPRPRCQLSPLLTTPLLACRDHIRSRTFPPWRISLTPQPFSLSGMVEMWQNV